MGYPYSLEVLDGSAQLIPEDLRQGNLEPENSGVVRASPALAERRARWRKSPSAGPLPDVRVLPLGIEHPVLPDAPTLVGPALDAPVDAAGGAGEDLDDQVRRALDVLLLDDRGPLVGDEEEVGLDESWGERMTSVGAKRKLPETVLSTNRRGGS